MYNIITINITYVSFLNIISCTDGKILVRINIGIAFIFRSHPGPIQLVVFVPVGLSSFLHLLQVFLGVEDVRTTKGLHERTQLIEHEDSET
jgi:hypothetical protein